MSTERMSFGFNSLIPETYKTKAEAFAKCLQHKLLSLGRLDTSSDHFGDETRKRLSDGNQQQGDSGTFNSYPDYSKQVQNSSQQIEEERTSSETSQKTDKTDESDEEFCSHSESENSDLSEQKRLRGSEESKQKLTSMSSEDSTVESWSSCQDNLTDFERYDSENEDFSCLASQIRGSPKLRNLNIRCKRKEIREKPWKRNSRKNYSSSTESVDSESRGIKQTPNHQMENFDSDSHLQYILLDGLEDDEVPHRILRESSSTSNLEKHFSRSCEDSRKVEFPRSWRSKVNRNVKEEFLMGSDMSQLPDYVRTTNGEQKEEPCEKKFPASSDFMEEDNIKINELLNRLKFAEIATDFEDVEYDEVESMKNFTTDDVSRSVKKMGDVIVECQCDNLRTDLELPQEWISEDFVVTSVEVLHHKDEPSVSDGSEIEKEEVQIIVEPKKETEDKSNENKDDDDDEILNSRSKLRRCSSLKTWKTPPGTPGAKKIVRFADALGLDLADVRTFLDEIPKVPSSAYEDLHFDVPSLPESNPPPPPPTPTLIPLFQQPGNKMDFLDKVQQQKVCLETALVTDTGILTITGYVRVQNISFHKSVHVRYSLNNWETFSDLQASYVPNSCDGFSDKFSFVLYGHTLKIGEKLEFALRLECSGTQHWDNNGGLNYVFHCLPQTPTNSFFSSLYSNQVDPWFDFY